ncbi:hypothetical protein CDL15_Pgr028808 [Punica granatum]|uniref:Uncharacterized protein n=1 Tax=Punica granatum TaxID=22663 RepID=A0A218VYD3_PUNGR|nr:hypothetical protein CDL15_Pgr028808 [Punica granatum]
MDVSCPEGSSSLCGRWWAIAVVKVRFAPRRHSISMETLASMLNGLLDRLLLRLHGGYLLVGLFPC